MNTQTQSASAQIAFPYSTQEIRVILINGAPWFIAQDICDILEQPDTSKVCSRLDDDEKGTHIVRTLGGNQEMTIINESGLYSLILTSRKPEAKRFKKWVTNEVLPSIRKTGKYELNAPAPQAQPEPKNIHIPLTPQERKQIVDAVANVSRYFRVHLYAAVSAAIYKPIFDHYGVTKIDHLNAAKLDEILAMFKRMGTTAHAYCMKQCQEERLVMDGLHACVGVQITEQPRQLTLPN